MPDAPAVGLGAACEFACASMEQRAERFAATPDYILSALHWIGVGVLSNGAGAVGLQSPTDVRPTRPLDPVQEGISFSRRYQGARRPSTVNYGPATTVYNRFNRWSRRGSWLAMLAALAEAGWAAQTAAIDGTYAKAHPLCPRRQRGAQAQAIGPSRGGATTKGSTSCPTSSSGPPSSISTRATGATLKTALAVLADAPGRIRRFLADEGYDADWLRADLREAASCR